MTRVRSQRNAALISAKCSCAMRVVLHVVALLHHVVAGCTGSTERADRDASRAARRTPQLRVARDPVELPLELADGRLVRVELLALRRGRQRAQPRQVAQREVEHALLLERARWRSASMLPRRRPASAAEQALVGVARLIVRLHRRARDRSTTCGAWTPRACRRGCRRRAAAKRSACPAAPWTGARTAGRRSGLRPSDRRRRCPGRARLVRAPVSISTVPRSWPPPTEPSCGS